MTTLLNDLKRFDTINVQGNFYPIDRVTEKALLAVVGTNGEGDIKKRWIPKSVLKNLQKDDLTSEAGVVYRCDQLPYFITKNF